MKNDTPAICMSCLVYFWLINMVWSWGEMRPKEIKIHNYKSICSDIAEFKLSVDDNITILIGANESGKTNILEALHKFSNGLFVDQDVPYSSGAAAKPWEANQDLPMVSVEYLVEDSDQEFFNSLYGGVRGQSRVTVTRFFSGALEITSPEVDPRSNVRATIERIQTSVHDFRPVMRAYFKDYQKVRRHEADSTQSASLRWRSIYDRVEILKQNPTEENFRRAVQKFRRLRTGLDDLSNPVETYESKISVPLASISEELDSLGNLIESGGVAKQLEERLPSFELVEAIPHRWLDDVYEVDRVLDVRDVDPELDSIRRLLRLADLDLANIRKLSDPLQQDQLDEASKRVTASLQAVWQEQERVEIELRWTSEGNSKLAIDIVSGGLRGSPKQRSNGFRWFLEFYLMYAAVVSDARPTFLLLEEPGIYLHPAVQESFKTMLREQITDNTQVMYTTHLPGMYDHQSPQCCRGVRKSDGPRPVTIIATKSDSGSQAITWEVAKASLGITNPEITLYPKNVLVEGAADWIYLLAFAQQLVKTAPELHEIATGLIHIRPGRGVGWIRQSIPFFMQPGIRSVVVLDDDEAGRTLKRDLEAEFNLPNEYIIKIITLEEPGNNKELLGLGEHEIEDFLGRDKYLELVNRSYGAGHQIAKSDVKGKQNKIGARMSQLLKDKYDVRLDKNLPALKLMDAMRANGISEVEENTQMLFGALLKDISSAFNSQ